ncbi:MAG: PQQ-binding-like beta-propeller repeat protein [Candidatus Tumulicola sp.]
MDVRRALLSATASLSSLVWSGCSGSGGGAGLPTASARALVAQAAGGVNWPEFRFDDHRTGVNPHETQITKTNVRSLQLAWEDQLGKLVDYSSPAVVNGTVYIGSTDGRLWAYDANGCSQSLCTKPAWSSTTIAQIMDSPTVANGFVYIGSQTSRTSNDGKLDVFSAAGCGQPQCPPLWQGLAGHDAILQSAPAVAAGSVFVGAYDGKLYAFSANGCGASTCAPLWTATTGGSIESSPTVAKGVAYVGSDDGNLYAFRATGCGAQTCAPLWKGTLGYSVFDSSPAIANGNVYIGSQHGVAAFKAAGCGQSTCAPLWQAANSADFFNGSPAVTKKRVYVGVEDGLAVYAAAGCGASKCNPLWTDSGSGFQAAVVSSPTVANGVVYAGRNTGELLAWLEGPCGSSNCTNIWSGAINEEVVSSSPTVVNGHIYIGSADKFFPEDSAGRIYVFALPHGNRPQHR